MAQADPLTLVIAGGGTSGWMVAAALGQFLEGNFRVRLVESEAIGTVGVGEATIPQIRLFNEGLGLDEDAFLRATQGTIKLGIEFVDWLRPGERYMHAFGAIGRAAGLLAFQHYWLRGRADGFAKPLAAYSLNEMAARAGKMHRGDPLTGKTLPSLPYAFHFDAALYAAYLRRFAERRGVRRTEGRITSVEQHGESGDVTAIVLDSGERIQGDLFIDCSGFAALLIENALGAGWEDWSRWLPCDRAVAAPSRSSGALEPYTRATAQATGWQWRIPLQHRTGNGHVFCSSFATDDEAITTLLRGLDGEPLADPRILRFAAGKRRHAWSHNVVSIGLASGFLEPLESTSIHLVQSAIARLLKLLPGRPIRAPDRDEYNRQTDFEMERIRDFLILHYRLSERQEPFWRALRDVALPEALQAKIDLFAATGHIVREHEELFTEEGWLQVMVGQGLQPEGYHPLAAQLAETDLREYLSTIEALYAREVLHMPTHRDMIARNCAAPVPAEMTA
jgi:tryptophan halogenase